MDLYKKNTIQIFNVDKLSHKRNATSIGYTKVLVTYQSVLHYYYLSLIQLDSDQDFKAV